MLSGGYIKSDSANIRIVVTMRFFIYCSQPNAYKLRTEGRRIDMDEFLMAYHIAGFIFVCLSIVQIVRNLIKDLHSDIRSSRRNKRKKRK